MSFWAKLLGLGQEKPKPLLSPAPKPRQRRKPKTKPTSSPKPTPSVPPAPQAPVHKAPKRPLRSSDLKNLERAKATIKERKAKGLPVGRPKGSRQRAYAGRHTCGAAYVDVERNLTELSDLLDNVDADTFRDGASPVDRDQATNTYTELTKAFDRLRDACGCVSDSQGRCIFSPEKTYADFRALLPQLQAAIQKKSAPQALEVTEELQKKFDWLMETAEKG